MIDYTRAYKTKETLETVAGVIGTLVALSVVISKDATNLELDWPIILLLYWLINVSVTVAVRAIFLYVQGLFSNERY